MSDSADAPEMDERTREYVEGLRHMGEFLESEPLLVQQNCAGTGQNIFIYVSGDELPEMIRRLHGAEKWARGPNIGAKKKFGPHSLIVFTTRSGVCKQVVTGYQEVTRNADLGTELPKGARGVREVTTLIYEIDEPVTEWQCPDSLLSTTPKGSDQ